MVPEIIVPTVSVKLEISFFSSSGHDNNPCRCSDALLNIFKISFNKIFFTSLFSSSGPLQSNMIFEILNSLECWLNQKVWFYNFSCSRHQTKKFVKSVGLLLKELWRDYWISKKIIFLFRVSAFYLKNNMGRIQFDKLSSNSVGKKRFKVQ